MLLDQVMSDYQEPEERVRYFNFDSARPLVQRLAAQYRHAIFAPQAEHARAYPISKACGRPWVRFVRVLHLLADVTVDPKTSIVDKLSIRGFRGTYGDDLQVLLRASRLLAHGLPGEALAACTDLGGYGSGPVDAIRQLAGGLRQAANAMPMEQFDALIRTIRGRPARTVATDRQIEGNIETIGREYYKIRVSDGILYKCARMENETLRRGDTVTFKVRRTLYGETEIVAVQFKARHPKWDEIRMHGYWHGCSCPNMGNLLSISVRSQGS